MACPKQLSWVSNPTQMARSEQQGYAQYVVYDYNNRILECLARLALYTQNALWQQLADRSYALQTFIQAVGGAGEKPSDIGGFFEAIDDPWLARGGGYNFMGTTYLTELALDTNLQLLLKGTVMTPGFTNCTIAPL